MFINLSDLFAQLLYLMRRELGPGVGIGCLAKNGNALLIHRVQGSSNTLEALM